jgi:anaerobic ribonucleoside-triphosphate reductase activating protein
MNRPSAGRRSTGINLALFLPRSSVNGPGVRAVVWVQGCRLRCSGCRNMTMQSRRVVERVSVHDLLDRIRAIGDIEGITLSGGEPFQQAAPLAAFARGCARLGLSVMAYSGYTLREILTSRDPARLQLLACLDILVDGRFVRGSTAVKGWRGGAGQGLHFLSARYQDLREHPEAWPDPEAEVHVTASGRVLLTGFPTAEMRREIARIMGTSIQWA